MAHHKVVKLDESKLSFDGLGGKLIGIGLLLAVAGAAVAFSYVKPWTAAGPESDGPSLVRHFWHAYLLAFIFFLGITVGSLFFTVLHHLARAGWSTTVRRIAERLSGNFFLMALLFIPLVSGLRWIYPWVDPRLVNQAAREHFLEGKADWLTQNAVIMRCAIYFVIWLIISAFYRGLSLRQDQERDVARKVAASRTMEFFSPLSMIAIALTLSLAAFDLLMSLNPRWYSTIFGVYIFAGFFLSFLAFTILLTLWMKSNGRIGDAINVEHYHDLGKLLFAFTFFWGYVAFSQYMLIWYANLPEETQWYQPRQIGVWASLSLILLFCHLLIPWPGLLSRHAKRVLPILAFWCVWQLISQFLDLFWIIMPQQWINHVSAWGSQSHVSPQTMVDFLAGRRNVYELAPGFTNHMTDVNFPFTPEAWAVTMGVFFLFGGLYMISTALLFQGKKLVAVGDPRLHEALAFENA